MSLRFSAGFYAKPLKLDMRPNAKLTGAFNKRGAMKMNDKNSEVTDKDKGSASEFSELLCGDFTPTPRDNALYELAKRYHHDCEEYDLKVCTGGMGRDGILPANSDEFRLINKNALHVRMRLIKEYFDYGFTGKEMQRAISNYRI